MIPSMRVSVFGISRSGKDYSISSAVRFLNYFGLPFEHFPGIPTVRAYSKLILGKEFSLTSMEEKGLLMEIFRKMASNRESVPYLIQDEHYSFPTLYGGRPLMNEYTSAKFPFFLKEGEDGREYEVMLKKEWISDCDLMFYLNPDPSTVLNRIQSSNGSKRNSQITEEDIDMWMRFEVSCLREMCSERNIPFKVLDVNEGAATKIIMGILKAKGEFAET